MELLLMTKKSGIIDNIPLVHWPLFLLASKIFLAKDTAIDGKEPRLSQEEVWDRILRDEYMKYAVQECYYTLKLVLTSVLDTEGKKWVERVYDEIQRSIANRSILVDIELNKLPLRIQKVTALLGILEARHNDNGRAPHSAWRNYDDFNEYFWSLNCFELSWPWRITSPFFLKPTPRSKMNVVTCVVATTYGHVYIECPMGEPIPF
ncbi:unnamed protein product [Cuscuta campestris]|uniref:1,3-beta-glucan synthase component FKS1-like domain-containing protein n=1 Tax=Cuscuta campestris TaxID=132261 RepID=A0A484KSK9_9ASTE|nr:unnamed protein product [Cuscuta campestris]